MTQIFIGVDALDGEQVIALAHGDHYHVASNDDGDSREQIKAWFEENLTEDKVNFYVHAWPVREQSEVTDLDLIYDDGI
ncbi:hypothetical protein ACLPBM_20410 [Escherichia coli]|uniref:hypothetical protein n=1 Tax=Enterobacterales TaxID=91347 RepID=UPI00389140D7